MKKILPAVLLLVSWSPFSQANNWRFDLTPYLWATGLNGTETIRGRPLEVDADFSDILEALDYGAAARLEGRTDGWGWFGDAFYAKLSGEAALPAAALSGEVRQTLLEAGITFPFADDLEVYAGLRNQDVDISLGLSGIGKVSGDQNWTDGMVGFLWKPVDTNRWLYWLRADAGAGDSDATWLVATGIGYRLSDSMTLQLGYRHLDTEYENGDFGWDMVQSGIGLGLGFSW